jgi:hypothetical protein
MSSPTQLAEFQQQVKLWSSEVIYFAWDYIAAFRARGRVNATTHETLTVVHRYNRGKTKRKPSRRKNVLRLNDPGVYMIRRKT